MSGTIGSRLGVSAVVVVCLGMLVVTAPAGAQRGPGGGYGGYGPSGCSSESAGGYGAYGDCDNSSPAATISLSPRSPRSGQVVELFASSTGRGLTYAWDLDGDGAYDDSTDAQPTQTYAAGTQTAKLQVTDENGRVGVARRAFTVRETNRTPTVTLSSPGRARVGVPVSLSAYAYDYDDTVLRLELDTDGDGAYDVASPPGDTQGFLSVNDVVFPTAGTRAISARVTDAAGATSVQRRTLEVTATNLAPFVTASLGAQRVRTNTDRLLYFSGSDLDGRIAKYEFDLDGNGTFETDRGTSSSVTANYATEGVREIAARVTDNDGATRETVTRLTVSDAIVPPTVGQLSEFTFSGTRALFVFASDADGRIAQYAWDSDGDGVFDDLVGPNATAFPLAGLAPGEYEIGVRVTDDSGATATRRRVVRIATPTVVGTPSISANDAQSFQQQLTAGREVRFFASPPLAESGTNPQFAWDLDLDGEFDDSPPNGQQPSRTFPDPGDYTVAVRSTGPDASTAVARLTFTVVPATGNQPPRISGISATRSTPRIGTTVTFSSFASDAEGGPLTYAWDLDDDGEYDDSASPSAGVPVALAGRFTIGVRVTDDQGAASVRRQDFEAHSGNIAPRVTVFSGSDNVAVVGVAETVQASAQDDDDDITQLEWDLDDDGDFDDRVDAAPFPSAFLSGSVSKTFETVGPARVRVRATDTAGATTTTTFVYDVEAPQPNRPPTFTSASGATRGRVGRPIPLSVFASDPDQPCCAPLAIAWDTDDDGAYDDATGSSTSVTYATEGVKRIRAQVTDAGGLTDSGVTTIDIREDNVAPTLSLSANGQSRVGQTQSLFVNASDPDSGAVFYGPPPEPCTFCPSPAASLSVAWDLDADGAFDDTPEIISGQFGFRSYAITHTSTAARVIAARVTDGDGGVVTETIQLNPADDNLPPAVTSFPRPATIVAGEPTTFVAYADDPDQDCCTFSGITYAWDTDGDGFDDGTTSTIGVTFPTAGTRTVAVRVTDDDGATAIHEQTVRVGSATPAATFTYAPAAPGAGEPVTATSTATDDDGTIAARSWDTDGDGEFDDGTGTTATGTFPEGAYRIGHKVVDNTGDVGIDYQVVTVGPGNGTPDPVASFGVSTPRRVNRDITLTSTSTDPQGASTITAFAWDLDGDGAYDDATGATTTTRFATTGAKTVGLRVTDADGNVDTDSTTINVAANQPPVAAFTRSPLVSELDEAVTFTSTAADPDGTVTAVAWDLDDDGSYDDAAGTSATRTFTTVGSKTIRQRVTDDDGAVDTVIVVIDVVDGRPVARFTVAPGSPATNQDVTFTSTSVDPNGTIASSAWDLDDDGAFDDAATATATRRYTSPGDRRVALRVTDDDGRSTTTSQVIRVRPDNLAPLVRLDASRTRVRTSEVVVLRAVVSDPEGQAVTYAFDVGDGLGYGDPGPGATRSFQPTGAGTRDVRVRVTDPAGAETVAELSLVVGADNALPVLSAAADQARKRRSATGGATFVLRGSAFDEDDSSFDAQAMPQYDDGIAEWLWDVNGDGDYSDAADRRGANLSTIEVELGAGGTGDVAHTVGVQVRDGFGGTTTRTLALTSYDGNAAPTGSVYHWPFDAQRNVDITLNGYGSDPDGDTVTFDWDLDLDGAFDDASGRSANWTFTERGRNVVRLRLRDTGTPVAETIIPYTIVVTGARPVVTIASDPFSPDTGQSVTLTGTATDPDGTIASTAWDLDDDGEFDDATGLTATRTFATGSRRVALRATDNDGDQTVQTRTIVVHAPIQFDGQDAGIGTPSPTATNADGDPVSVTSTVSPTTGEVTVSIVRGVQAAQPGGCVDLDFEFSIRGAASGVVLIVRRPGVADGRVTASPVRDAGGTPTGRWTAHLDCVSQATLLVEYDLPKLPPASGVDHIGPVPVGRVELIDPQGVVHDRAEYEEFLADKGPDITEDEMTAARAAAAITGATVTLQRLAADGETWETVNPDDPGISPNVNPQTTGTNGLFQWDVSAGVYRVLVTAPGFTGVTSDSAVIPPPKLDLHIPLEPNARPVAGFDIVGTPQATRPVSFASTSTVANGTVVDYEWDLDGDGGYDDATGSSATTTFPTAGTRTVRLKVRDGDGQVDTITRTVTVEADPTPTAAFGVSTPRRVNRDITLTSTSTDPQGASTITAFAWDLDGDGAYDDATAATATTRFATSGAKTVGLRITDADGNVDTDTMTITIMANQVPLAGFSVAPAAPTTGQTVTFTSSSSDPDGGIAAYAWDLDGDGAYDDATTQVATTTFASPGERRVALRVTDADAATATVTRDIAVAAAPTTGGGGTGEGATGGGAAGSGTGGGTGGGEVGSGAVPGTGTGAGSTGGSGAGAGGGSSGGTTTPFSLLVTKVSVALKRLGTTGIPISVTCTSACSATVLATVDKATARKLGLGKVTRVGTVTRVLTAKKATRLTIKLPAKAKAKIRRLKTLTVSMRVTVKAAGTTKLVVRTVRVTIK